MKVQASLLIVALFCLLLPVDVQSGAILSMTCCWACNAALATCVGATAVSTAGVAAPACVAAHTACMAACAGAIVLPTP